MLMRPFISVCVGAFLATSTMAQPLEPITLDPIAHADAELLVIGRDGTELRYSPDALETLDTYRVSTTTPWREEPAVFDGVLLRDVLEASGLDAVNEIRVIAENDFATTIPRVVWETVPILVATRVDGKAHSRRARGPIQFIIPMEDYMSSAVATEAHLVWMAARIEAE